MSFDLHRNRLFRYGHKLSFPMVIGLILSQSCDSSYSQTRPKSDVYQLANNSQKYQNTDDDIPEFLAEAYVNCAPISNRSLDMGCRIEHDGEKLDLGELFESWQWSVEGIDPSLVVIFEDTNEAWHVSYSFAGKNKRANRLMRENAVARFSAQILGERQSWVESHPLSVGEDVDNPVPTGAMD